MSISASHTCSGDASTSKDCSNLIAKRLQVLGGVDVAAPAPAAPRDRRAALAPRRTASPRRRPGSAPPSHGNLVNSPAGLRQSPALVPVAGGDHLGQDRERRFLAADCSEVQAEGGREPA